jgi:hypothetical protein
MRSRLFLLLPILLVLTVFGWGAVASAHPCHEHRADTRARTMAGQYETVLRGTPESESLSGCVGGCCAGSASCAAQCQAGIATADTLGIRLFPARCDFMPTDPTPLTGWSPRAEYDPPKPIA